LQKTQYHCPKSVDEALGLLDKNKGSYRILAGGTDLVVDLNEGRGPAFEDLIYLGHIGEMRSVRKHESVLEIGALVTHEEIEAHRLVLEEAPLLAAAAGTIGGPAIRTMGTMGGNVVRASPAGDLIAGLLALDALVNVISVSGKKQYGIRDFLLGPQRTRLDEGELLFSVSIPLNINRRTGQSFLKLGKRKAMSIALASSAIAVTLDPSSLWVSDLRISLGSVAPTAMRAIRAEDYLRNRPVETLELERAAEFAREECNPITDIRGSEGYRREMVAVLVKRGLSEACRKALRRQV